MFGIVPKNEGGKSGIDVRISSLNIVLLTCNRDKHASGFVKLAISRRILAEGGRNGQSFERIGWKTPSQKLI